MRYEKRSIGGRLTRSGRAWQRNVVIPAQAGIHKRFTAQPADDAARLWIPACAGMTNSNSRCKNEPFGLSPELVEGSKPCAALRPFDKLRAQRERLFIERTPLE